MHTTSHPCPRATSRQPPKPPVPSNLAARSPEARERGEREVGPARQGAAFCVQGERPPGAFVDMAGALFGFGRAALAAKTGESGLSHAWKFYKDGVGASRCPGRARAEKKRASGTPPADPVLIERKEIVF